MNARLSLLLIWTVALLHTQSAGSAPADDRGSAQTTTFSSLDKPAADAETLAPGVVRFQDADLLMVLDVYQELSGRTVLRPSSLPAAKINLRSQTPLTRQEAMQALDSVLALNGIAMIPQGHKFVKAVPAAEAGTAAGPISDLPADDLPDTGSFLTRIVRVEHVRASSVLPALQPLAKLPNSLVAIDNAGVILLRDYSENVKRMLELLAQIDVPDQPPPRILRAAVLLFFISGLIAWLIYPRYLGVSRSRALLFWLAAFLLGVCAISCRNPELTSARSDHARVISLMCAGLLPAVLLPFLIRLYQKWIGGHLTKEEKAPGTAGLRAWLRAQNLWMSGSIALFAWLGYGCSFWAILILTLLLLLGHPGLRLISQPATPPASGSTDLSAERRKVLSLLASGKITVPKSINLLNALKEPGHPAPAKPIQATRHIVLAGSLIVALGFFLPWSTRELVPAAVHPTQSAETKPGPRRLAQPGAELQPDAPSPARGGNVQHGLGWWILLLAATAAILPHLTGALDASSIRALTALALGVGGVMLFYLLTADFQSAGIGLMLALTGYAVALVGTFKSTG